MTSIQLSEKLSRQVSEAAADAGEPVELFVARAVALEAERARTARLFAERRARADLPRALAILNRQGGAPPEPDDELGA